MKTFALFFLAHLITVSVSAQNEYKKLPDVSVKNLSGETLSTTSFTNEGPIYISFWATWCKPCIKELEAVSSDYYDDWQAAGVKVIAVSVDDSRTSSKVKPSIDARGWEFEIYLDENADLQRALSITSVPHSFILDKEGNIVWSHSGYSEGDEIKIDEIIKRLLNGESIEK